MTNPTKLQAAVDVKSLRRERRKLRRARAALKRQKKLVVVNKVSTTKFKRTRAKKNAAGNIVQKATMEFTLNHLLDTSHLIQTLFYPSLGVYRGLAKGSATTALATLKKTFDLTIAANGSLGLSWVPTDLTGAGAISYFVGVAGNDPDPYQASSTKVAGFFNATNPSTDYRVVSAHLILIPSASMLNNNGEGQLAYFPSWPGAVAGGAAYLRANVDQVYWTKPVSAPKSYVMNWVPNQYEVDFKKSGNAYDDPSSFMFYFYNGANIMNYRVEMQITVEYMPTVAYRPYVMREPPLIPLSSYDDLNRHLVSCWDSTVLVDYEYWRADIAARESKGGHTVVEKVMNAGTGPLTYGQIVGRGAGKILSGIAEVIDTNDNYIPDVIEMPLRYAAKKVMGS